MKSIDLETMYGRSINPQELADFLGIDRRTVIKYAHKWGGVEVTPGTWRFFEKRILEVLNAEHCFEKGNKALSRECDRSKHNPTEDVSRYEQEISSRGPGVGKGNKKKVGGEVIPDKYGIFSNRPLVQ